MDNNWWGWYCVIFLLMCVTLCVSYFADICEIGGKSCVVYFLEDSENG